MKYCLSFMGALFLSFSLQAASWFNWNSSPTSIEELSAFAELQNYQSIKEHFYYNCQNDSSAIEWLKEKAQTHAPLAYMYMRHLVLQKPQTGVAREEVYFYAFLCLLQVKASLMQCRHPEVLNNVNVYTIFKNHIKKQLIAAGLNTEHSHAFESTWPDSETMVKRLTTWYEAHKINLIAPPHWIFFVTETQGYFKGNTITYGAVNLNKKIHTYSIEEIFCGKDQNNQRRFEMAFYSTRRILLELRNIFDNEN